MKAGPTCGPEQRAGERHAELNRKLRRRLKVWLSMAESQINAARQCEQRDQTLRAEYHRREALQLLEQIGLENLTVRPIP